jgi:DNA uptake protein ComE-like DNA-binding protein
LDVKPFSPLPELHDLASIIESGQQLKKLRAQVEALSKIKDVQPFAPIEIKDHSEMETLIDSVESLQARLARGNTLINANKALQEELDLEYAQVIKELGGICPSCDQPFGVHQHD